MVKPPIKIDDSPKQQADSSSESKQAAAGLQMVVISSPRTTDSPTRNASPYKRKPSQLAAPSPVKRSPLKRNTDSPEQESSPRKRLTCALEIATVKYSPQKLFQGLDSSDKTGLGSPLKRESSRLSVLSPVKSSPQKRHADSNEQESSPRKRLASVLDLSTLKNSPQKSSQVLGSPRKILIPSDNHNAKMLPGLRSPRKKCMADIQSPRKKIHLSNDNLNSYDPEEEVQKILRTRISQINSPPSIEGYEKERKQLYDLIKRTVVTGESNSMLLIGPRGCGKSMLIQSVVENLYEDEKIKQDLLLVKLHGLLQSDDRIALREITRQLQLENTVGDKVFGSFAETLQFLLEALKKGDESSKPIVFVLEEFDLFAQHKNQTLLYNLFDISQSAQAPICVLGITCRLDVVELLEKRVKSRFSHRQIYLFNKLSLEQYRRLCRDYLSLPESFGDKDFAKSWNSNIQTLLDEVAVKDVLERQYSLMNDVRGLISLLVKYLKFARRRSGMQVYDKAIVMKAYEHLQTLELIRGHSGGGGTSQKEYRLMDLLVHPAQIMDALQKYPNCPTEMKQWATQSIS
ncbi:origin recognition complex subunit 4 [Elysia marginata]|uniref:Origin recognition complex subunit 4 n=1 Tax=Elysia marginata TaxID=1093978 RepID=A0AAV4IRQ0_9GAST|nr:origin recognition complex subunit 4 [Elysia marginata]